MVVMLRLQEALSLKQGQRLVVGPSGAPRDDPVMLLLLLQGQLPLRPPQSTQSIETVLQKSGVSVALVSTDGSQALCELHWVLGLKRQDLQEHRMAQKNLKRILAQDLHQVHLKLATRFNAVKFRDCV